MHGVWIEKGPEDWQIFQQENGSAKIALSGGWRVPKAALDVGILSAVPMVRVARQEDACPVVPWAAAACTHTVKNEEGTWQIEMEVPAGGLYKIETTLDTVSVREGLSWRFRGDVRFHIGVGDIFLIAGQSNAAGYAMDTAYDAPDMRVHLLRNCQSWELACHPMNETTDAEDSPNADIRINGASPYLTFAKRYADASGRPVGLVQSAMSGQGISRWDTREDGALFRNMLARVKNCGGKLAGVLWYQGCTDAFSDKAGNYLETFTHVVNSTREALGYSVPFFTFQLNRWREPCEDSFWGMLREAQRMAAITLPDVYVLPAIDAAVYDHVHNNASACVMLGERLARQCIPVLLGGAVYAAPDIARIHTRGQQLILHFNHCECMQMRTGKAEDNGFTVADDEGEVPLKACEAGEAGSVVLTAGRALCGQAQVSFAWQADPTCAPPIDSASHLPPLSFYKVGTG